MSVIKPLQHSLRVCLKYIKINIVFSLIIQAIKVCSRKPARYKATLPHGSHFCDTNTSNYNKHLINIKKMFSPSLVSRGRNSWESKGSFRRH